MHVIFSSTAKSQIRYCQHSIYCFFVTEKPAEQSSAGLLRLDTNISRRYYIYFFGAKHLGIRFVDYSMIVATLPEPTVLPPSRYQTGVLQCANGDFSCDLWGKIWIFHCVRVVFGDFVIMVLSLPLSGLPNNLHIIPYNL